MFKRIFGSLIWLGSPESMKYKGIVMKANPNLHPELAERLRVVLRRGSSVLDLGAGQGAFSMRLKDSGYEVLAVDQDAANFHATGIPFVQLNFNDSASVAKFASENEGRFDAVIGMEVIEHVENPWDYVRLLKCLAKPAGLIVVTTPNVESWVSRWNYLFSGRLSHFEDEDYTGSGHINPVSPWELRLIAESLNLTNVQVFEACRLPVFWVTRNLRLMVGSFVLAPIRLLMAGRVGGDITVCIACKPTSTTIA